MSVYLLHLHPSYKQARHYLGFAEDVAPRVYAHLHGKGARLTQVATDAGCELILVRVWEGASRTDERTLKNRKNAPQLCPICQGLGVQMPLLLGEPAYVPQMETACEQVEVLAPVADDQLCFDDLAKDWDELAAYIDEQDRLWLASRGIDFEAELADLHEDMADRAFWASGAW